MKAIWILSFLLAAPAARACDAKNSQTFDIQVTDKGFEPNAINAAPDKCVVLKVKRVSELTCATAIQVPDKKIKKELPLNKTVEIDLGVLAKGEVRFGCGMHMMEKGTITVK